MWFFCGTQKGAEQLRKCVTPVKDSQGLTGLERPPLSGLGQDQAGDRPVMEGLRICSKEIRGKGRER